MATRATQREGKSPLLVLVSCGSLPASPVAESAGTTVLGRRAAGFLLLAPHLTTGLTPVVAWLTWLGVSPWPQGRRHRKPPSHTGNLGVAFLQGIGVVTQAPAAEPPYPGQHSIRRMRRRTPASTGHPSRPADWASCPHCAGHASRSYTPVGDEPRRCGQPVSASAAITWPITCTRQVTDPRGTVRSCGCCRCRRSRSRQSCVRRRCR